MDNRIDRPGTGLGSTAVRSLEPPLREGRGGTSVERAAAAVLGSRRGVTSWKVNLAGPFDPNAPRGTYLDIVV